MLKAAIFDLDGTLLNTIEDLGDSANAALADMGFPKRTYEEYKIFVGNGFRNLIKTAIPDDVKDNDEVLDKTVDMFQREYSDRYMNKTVPYAGIVDLINALRNQNIPIAVDSNKRESYTANLIDKFFTPGTFKMVLGEVADRPRKPDPVSVEKILDCFGLPASEVLFVGDTKVDIQTAKNSGCVSAGVLWGFRDREELEQEGADHIISDPSEIIKICNYSEPSKLFKNMR